MTDAAVAECPGRTEGDELATRWAAWRRLRDPAGRVALVLHYLPHARRLAAMAYAARAHDDLPFEDYVQLARLGLVESVDRFDPAQGVRFTTFSTKRIQGAIVDGLARGSERSSQVARLHRLRRERLDAVPDEAGTPQAVAHPDPGTPMAPTDMLIELGIGYALGLLLEGTGMLDADGWHGGGLAHAPSPEHLCGQRQEAEDRRRHLLAGLDHLTPRQQAVLRGHYLQGQSFTEVAARLGLTRGRVAQLHQLALHGLRRKLSSVSSTIVTPSDSS